MLSTIVKLPIVKIYINHLKDIKAQIPKLAPWAFPGLILGKLIFIL